MGPIHPFARGIARSDAWGAAWKGAGEATGQPLPTLEGAGALIFFSVVGWQPRRKMRTNAANRATCASQTDEHAREVLRPELLMVRGGGRMKQETVGGETDLEGIIVCSGHAWTGTMQCGQQRERIRRMNE
jgi:hypothetical protein